MTQVFKVGAIVAIIPMQRTGHGLGWDIYDSDDSHRMTLYAADSKTRNNDGLVLCPVRENDIVRIDDEGHLVWIRRLSRGNWQDFNLSVETYK